MNDIEILIENFKNSTVTFYLPKDTIEVFLDIIDNRRLTNGSYNIYSIQVPNLIIQEPMAMTKQKFQFQILPRLDTQVDP
jgi:hypothetical protein